MENLSSESFKFTPEIDLTAFKRHGKFGQILEVKRLRPEHAPALQIALKRGSDHIANYFAWGEDAKGWNTKTTLFWIQKQIKQGLPSEHFVFFLGKDLVGMGSLGENGHFRHVQMAYWVTQGFLHQGIGESIARTLENLAMKYRPYQFIYINHDSSNRASGAIPQKLGYRYVGHSDAVISAKGESGLWFSWVKESTRYSECRNERMMDLRFADLWSRMILEVHPDLYDEQYAHDHVAALEQYRIEEENVRTNNQDEVA